MGELFAKQWSAVCGPHALLVRNSWNRGAHLYVDGDRVASYNGFLALNKRKPIMRHELREPDGVRVIEIFAYAMWSSKVKIVADGVHVGGDVF